MLTEEFEPNKTEAKQDRNITETMAIYSGHLME